MSTEMKATALLTEISDVIANRIMVASITWLLVGLALGGVIACYWLFHRYRDGIEWQHRREDYLEFYSKGDPK